MSALSLVVAGSVYAHIPLTPAILDDAFEDLERAQAATETTADSAAEASAILDFATAATELTALLNQEIRLHGKEQQQLLDAAVARAAGLDVELTWSDDHQRYFYIGRAYSRYLQRVPDGLDAGNARFHLIETDFYLGNAEDRDELQARAAMARDFLRSHPRHGKAEQVALFLAIDYRDLWRVCRKTDDDACANHYETLNRNHLEAIAARYSPARTGELARAMLRRFDAEVAAAE